MFTITANKIKVFKYVLQSNYFPALTTQKKLKSTTAVIIYCLIKTICIGNRSLFFLCPLCFDFLIL